MSILAGLDRDALESCLRSLKAKSEGGPDICILHHKPFLCYCNSCRRFVCAACLTTCSEHEYEPIERTIKSALADVDVRALIFQCRAYQNNLASHIAELRHEYGRSVSELETLREKLARQEALFAAQLALKEEILNEVAKWTEAADGALLEALRNFQDALAATNIGETNELRERIAVLEILVAQQTTDIAVEEERQQMIGCVLKHTEHSAVEDFEPLPLAFVVKLDIRTVNEKLVSKPAPPFFGQFVRALQGQQMMEICQGIYISPPVDLPFPQCCGSVSISCIKDRAFIYDSAKAVLYIYNYMEAALATLTDVGTFCSVMGYEKGVLVFANEKLYVMAAGVIPKHGEASICNYPTIDIGGLSYWVSFNGSCITYCNRAGRLCEVYPEDPHPVDLGIDNVYCVLSLTGVYISGLRCVYCDKLCDVKALYYNGDIKTIFNTQGNTVGCLVPSRSKPESLEDCAVFFGGNKIWRRGCVMKLPERFPVGYPLGLYRLEQDYYIVHNTRTMKWQLQRIYAD